MKIVVTSACFLFLTCCTSVCGPQRKDLTPEQVVERYLDVSLNMTGMDDKEQLLDLTTGNLHSAINAADDDTIANAFINRTLKLDSYSLVERRDRTPRESEVTFKIVYRETMVDGKKVEEPPKTETQNTVALIKEEGAWKIRDVINKRTSIEFFVADEVIKPGTEEAQPSEGEQDAGESATPEEDVPSPE